MSTFALLDKLTGRYQPALVKISLTFAEVIMAQRVWASFKSRKRGLGSVVAQHGHWDWAAKYGIVSDRSLQFIGLVVEEQLQGLMAVRTAPLLGRSAERKNLPILYIEYLETAPWNQVYYARSARFSGVGSALLGVAIELSQGMGFEGAIALHSLEQSEEFYRRYFEDLGLDLKEENLRYFEMSADEAAMFLEGVRYE